MWSQVWAWLPYLRGRKGQVCACNAARLMGICGVLDAEGGEEVAAGKVVSPLLPVGRIDSEGDEGQEKVCRQTFHAVTRISGWLSNVACVCSRRRAARRCGSII